MLYKIQYVTCKLPTNQHKLAKDKRKKAILILKSLEGTVELWLNLTSLVLSLGALLLLLKCNNLGLCMPLVCGLEGINKT